MKIQSRREFIVDSAKITGGAICAAALGHDLLAPHESAAAEIDFVETNCGLENGSGPKILVTYASKCGSTGEVAEAIGNVLCQQGAVVETKRIQSVREIEGYQAVIIGSAIHQSRWMPAATEFVTHHQNVLAKIPVAYFFTCLTLVVDSDKARRKARTFLDPLESEAPHVKPVSIGPFAGVLDYSRLSFMYLLEKSFHGFL